MDTIYVKIPFKKIFQKRQDGSYSGRVAFRIIDGEAKLMDGDETIGELGGAMGGRYELRFFKGEEEHEHEYYADAKTIWNAFCDAINKEDFKQ